jgi:hypothetical protein
MSRVQQALFAFTIAAALYGQDGAAPAGLETPWSIAPVFQEMGTHAGRVVAALDNVNTKAWVQKGASETYGEQVQSCRVQAKALADGAKALAANPEQLAASLELFFRLQALEAMLGSVEEGMRKYQSAADAQALASLEAETAPNRDRLQKYIVDLASDRERQLQVTDKEAQRCRALLTAPTSSKTGKKK